MQRSDIIKIAAGAAFSAAIIVVQSIQIDELRTLFDNQLDTMKKIANAINSQQSKDELDRTNGMIELATNARMASIVSYQLKNQNMSLVQLMQTGYLGALAKELRQDYVEDNVYARLNKLGVGFEFKDLGSGIKQIRERWLSPIAIGSHFDRSPSASLLIPGESIPAPQCNEDKPYLAYVLATNKEQKNNTTEVIISTESVPTPQYRFEISNAEGNITGAIESLQYRVLVDVGCTTTPNDELTNLTIEKISN